MRKTSLSDAKARLSALVDDAEHRGRKTLILRHGKPSAAVVPVDIAVGVAHAIRRRRAKPAALKRLRRVLSAFDRTRSPLRALDDLLATRR